MNVLAIETSCDETAAAVFTTERVVLASVVASQTELHRAFGGVVPEIASRAHVRAVLPVVDEALARANLTLAEIGVVAVHSTPGLVGSLVVGVSVAKMLSVALGVPLIAVNHVAGHIYACRLAAGRDIYPCLGLVVSGGHTALFDCPEPLTLKLLGTTRDDAAGEAFDKVAALLGLAQPGGPAVEVAARGGDAKAFAFPRAFAHDARLEFSFSGLKTAVLYAAYGQDASRAAEPPAGKRLADLAASFQAAVVDALALKCKQALKLTGHARLAVGGGVIANGSLRATLTDVCAKLGAELIVPPLALCTDNAAMAALAVEKIARGEFALPDLDAEPSFI